MKCKFLLCLSAVFSALLTPSLRAAVIWTEAERPIRSTMHRHPWWYDKVKRDQLSGGDFISNFDAKHVGEAEYKVAAPKAGEYEFWVRANPVQAKLSYRLNGGAWTPIDLEMDKIGETNIADDGKPDLRFIAWVKVGRVALKQGANDVAFRMDSANSNHGMLDCFVLANEPWEPHGILKPGEIAAAQDRETDKGWFAFDPPPDQFEANAGFDLRSLNEKEAGDGGYIRVRKSEFIHSTTGEPVRFWAVNGPPGDLKDPAELRRCARMLAKHGVNLVRIHGGYFDPDGKVDLAKVRHAIDVVEAMKSAGVYSHFSIYFPLWLEPKPNDSVLKGYNGHQHPFATVMFDPNFQREYESWWSALLTTPDQRTGRRLIDEPAVMGAEIQNEDSFFFWTFTPQNIPDPELRILEKQFGDWLTLRYGSFDAAYKHWNGMKTDRDAPAEGRMGFRPLWNMSNERSPRDKDNARFLAEAQRAFYQKEYQFLRKLGFKGVITASNWVTASPQYLTPLEKYSYTPCDFIDRHGYFSCGVKGQNDGWALMDGQTYADRSALRFDAEELGKPKEFVNPAMDIHYDDKPSMISETTFNRPNRYRTEAPLYYACYGALQGSNCIVHFALDGAHWSAKPGYFMQPWTLMAPTQMAQFPAAALIFRNRLIAEGESLVKLDLKISDLENLAGTPLPQDASFDELRLKDVPSGTTIHPGNVIDPLVHYAGRTDVRFSATGGPAHLADLKKFIDRAHQTVTSATGQLRVNYGKGLLTTNAPAAQGLCGNLRTATGSAGEMKDLSISSSLELGCIIAVSLDDKPLATSDRILLQVMSEEKTTDFRTEQDGSKRRITSIGHDPWQVHDLQGTVKLKRSDARNMKVYELDANGSRTRELGSADQIKLDPKVIYYLLAK